MITTNFEKIYNDAKEIKNKLESHPELTLVMEETKRNGEGDSFEEIYDDLEICLEDIFKSLKYKTKSKFNIHLVDETQYYSECYNDTEYVGNIAINTITNEEITTLFNCESAKEHMFECLEAEDEM